MYSLSRRAAPANRVDIKFKINNRKVEYTQMNTQKKKHCLAEIFQSGMLFQRGKKIVLWGEASPGETITAAFYRENAPRGTPPFLRGECSANQDGRFRITPPPQNAGEGYRLCITFGSTPPAHICLDHIGFGDIWLAGGQSNMEFFLKYDKDWDETKKLPRNPKIRMYNVPQRAFEGHTTHNKSGYGFWFDDSDPALEYFSAPAYSFSRDIQAAAGIPIGIIGCNWGGSTASAWVPEEVLCAPPLDRYLKEYREAVCGISSEKLTADSLLAWEFEDSAEHRDDFEPLLYGRGRSWQMEYMKSHAGDPVIPMGPYHMNRPCGLYHTMLSGLIPFSIKGILWYQGESDAGDYAFMYDKLLTGLIESWRKLWNDNLPFLIVQLAPFGEWLDCDNKGYALVREKQAAVAKTVPDVYLAGIMDLGNYYDIHPKEKMEVGRRLALLARGHIYGEKDLLCDAPEALCAALLNKRQILITFSHAARMDIGPKPSSWNVRAGDRDIKPADVTAKGSSLILTLPEDVPDGFVSLSVSLGDADYAEIYIRNSAGLSALPFNLKITQGNSL